MDDFATFFREEASALLVVVDVGGSDGSEADDVNGREGDDEDTAAFLLFDFSSLEVFLLVLLVDVDFFDIGIGRSQDVSPVASL